MIPAMDTDPELDFQIFGKSGSGFGSNKKQNHIIYGGLMIQAQNQSRIFSMIPDPDWDPIKSGI